jgi:dUTP pyrophosphatase
LVHPRSGLAIKHGISMVNTPGTIDAGYRGEIQVILINHDLHETFKISRLDRIAQLVVQRVEQVDFEVVTELPESVRGSGGFGSSGVR